MAIGAFCTSGGISAALTDKIARSAVDPSERAAVERRAGSSSRRAAF
jgi:hypothetical protein